MAGAKTKVVDVNKTSATEFLTGNAEPPVAESAPSAPGTGPIEEVMPPVAADALPRQPEPVPTVPIPGTRSLVPSDLPPTAPVVPTPSDPFQTLVKFTSGETYRTLAAMPVPGGCIVRLASVRGANFSDSICFVPDARISDGKLVGKPEPA